MQASLLINVRHVILWDFHCVVLGISTALFWGFYSLFFGFPLRYFWGFYYIIQQVTTTMFVRTQPHYLSRNLTIYQIAVANSPEFFLHQKYYCT